MTVNPSLDPIFESAGREWNVDPNLLRAVSLTESGGNVGTQPSKAGAQSLMQIMPDTARTLGMTSLSDPVQAIYGAAKYLNQGLDAEGSPEGALLYYHGGPGWRQAYGPESQGYVPTVAAHYQRLQATSQQPAGSFQVAQANTGTATPSPAGAASDTRGNPFASMSNADFLKAVTGQDAPTGATTPPASSPAAGSRAPETAGAPANPFASMSSDDFVNAVTGGTGPVKPTPPAQVTSPSSAPVKPLVQIPAVNDFAAGVTQGARDVALPLDRAIGSVNDAVPALGDLDRFVQRNIPGVGQLVGDPQAAVANLQAQRQTFDQQYSNSIPASVGRIAGNIGVTAPAMILGGGALGLAGSGAAELAGGSGTMLGRGIGAAGNLLSGTASLPAGSNRLLAAGTRAASFAANGALTGGTYSALTSGGSDRSLGDQVRTGAETGAVAGPVLGGVGNALSGLVRPFTESGRNALADAALARQAAGGPTTINATEIVPGSTPTLAQATGNAGLAAAERAVQSVRPQPFADVVARNNEARGLALDALRGDPQSLQGMIDARAQDAATSHPAVFARAQPRDPMPVVQQIDQILQSPSGQRDVVASALNNIRQKLTWETTAPDGTVTTAMQTDPAQLYGVRQAITDMLSPMAQGTASNARLAARELGQVKDVLDSTIEAGAPGYRQVLSDYAAASAPIDTQRYLQGLNLTDSLGNVTLGRVDAGLKRIATDQAKPGPLAAKSIPDDVMDGLQALRDDLRLQANSSLGKPIGSNTFQNLATNGALSSLGPLGSVAVLADKLPIVNMLGEGLRRSYAAQNAPVLDLLAARLANPLLGAPNLQAGNRLSPAMMNAVRSGSGAAGAGRNRLLQPAGP